MTAAYLTLNDKAYNAYRLVETGNPYKNLLASLLDQGVQIEACAVSMKSNGWGNEDLVPGVKVNAGAIGRLIQLVQEGYIQISHKRHTARRTNEVMTHDSSKG